VERRRPDVRVCPREFATVIAEFGDMSTAAGTGSKMGFDLRRQAFAIDRGPERRLREAIRHAKSSSNWAHF
jgi:hypothetical protein